MSARAVMWIIICMIILAACAPDPRLAAAAEQTRMQAAQDARDREQARTQQQTEWELKQHERQQITEQMIATMAEILRFATIAAALALTGIGVGIGFAGIQAGQAFGQAVILRARLIPLDKSTGQYPLLQYAGHGKFTLTNPNTEKVLMLDSASPSDRQLIASVESVQTAGIITRNAASHKTKPEGVTGLGWRHADVLYGEQEQFNE